MFMRHFNDQTSQAYFIPSMVSVVTDQGRESEWRFCGISKMADVAILPNHPCVTQRI